MQRNRLHGVWAAMPTPWTADYTIDTGLVSEMIARYAEYGLHGAYTTGTDGEMHVLDISAFRALAEAFGRGVSRIGLPAQMGCTWSHTDGVIERARIARDNGITRIQIALPSGIPLNDIEILHFFEALQEALPEMSFVHYNIARTGRFLTGSDYRAILKVAPNLIGSKQTGGEVSALIDVVEQAPGLDHFVVDGQIVPGALFGARGFYSFVANLAPHIAVTLWELCRRGRWEDAARLRERIALLFQRWRSLGVESLASPALAKIATRAGICSVMTLAVRSPYQSGNQDDVQALQQLISEAFPEFVMPRAA